MRTTLGTLGGADSLSLLDEYELAVKDGLRAVPPDAGEVLTAEDIASLPEVVQRYIRFAGAIGRARIWNYRLRFRGQLRNGPDSPWMTFEANQQSFVEPAARLFFIKASMFGVPFRTLHRYIGASATFRVRLAGLVTVVNAYGPEMDQSETVTLLNDICLLAPSTLVSASITWEEIDALCVRATFVNQGHTVSALLTFDESGALIDFLSHDRFRTTDGKTYTLLPWSTPIRDWAESDGRRLPVEAQAIWHDPAGEFAYGRFRILEVKYNVAG